MGWKQSRERNRLLQNKCIYQNCYTGGSFYIEEEDRYVRRYRSRRSAFLRKVGNRRVRRSKMTMRYGDYRKIYDYKWELI